MLSGAWRIDWSTSWLSNSILFSVRMKNDFENHPRFFLSIWLIFGSIWTTVKMMIVRKLIGILIVCSLMQGSFNKYLEVNTISIQMFFISLSFINNHINGIWRWYTLIKACLLDTVGGRLIILSRILGRIRI